ncbi:MAG: hypothetical protein AB1757_05900 [Acidobacteriota bacterium]
MKKLLLFFILVSLFIPVMPAFSDTSLVQKSKDEKAADKKDKEKKKDKDEPSSTAKTHVMWEKPADITARDLYYGPGGKEGAPELATTFKFIQRRTTGTSEKMDVEDNLGRKWVVKFGPEVRAEVAASRIIWAIGYHADQDYFVKRAHIEGRGGFDIGDVRFERDDDGFKSEGRWAWDANPFLGKREFEGLKVVTALIKNWDLKDLNNKIVRPSKKTGDPNKMIYYVSDVGASLGNTGSGFNDIGLFKDFPADRAINYENAKGHPVAFAAEPFITGTQNGEVMLYSKRKRCQEIFKGVKVESARWVGNLLAQLTDEQWRDAFRSANFTEQEIALYVKTFKERVRQLQELR